MTEKKDQELAPVGYVPPARKRVNNRPKPPGVDLGVSALSMGVNFVRRANDSERALCDALEQAVSLAYSFWETERDKGITDESRCTLLEQLEHVHFRPVFNRVVYLERKCLEVPGRYHPNLQTYGRAVRDAIAHYAPDLRDSIKPQPQPKLDD